MKPVKSYLVPLGFVGVLAYWFVSLVLFAAPLMVLRLPFWGMCLMVFGMFSPVGLLVRVATYAWAMFCLEDQPTAALVVYWISFALFVLGELLPAVLNLVCAVAARKGGR